MNKQRMAGTAGDPIENSGEEAQVPCADAPGCMRG